MITRGSVFQSSTGVNIAYDEYGDPRGTPVIFCHGWPSSRSMAELTDAAARELGVRIISPDRPGISGSTFVAGRELLDWPPIVRALASHLSLDRFRLLAISGGAPYAYATARALPHMVDAVAIVSGAPLIADRQDRSGLLRLYRWMLTLHTIRPGLLRILFHAARPFASTRPPLRLRPLLLKLLQPCDAAVLRDSAAFEACFESARRAWRGSARGVIADAEIYAKPWGFRLEQVEVPVRLWHGRKDRTFSFKLAEEVAAELPNCKLRIIDGAGHYSLPIRHIADILRDLISVTFPVRHDASG
ncbi:MAG: alpha/beta hydrolase [Chthoniobacterales bacterium]|nr:alpha/beta hydrolase [Chthoniobacterales bacterium]